MSENRPDDAAVEAQISRMSRRSFVWAGAATLGGLAAWRWLVTRRPDAGIPWPFRRALEVNEQITRDLYNPARESPTFAEAMAREPRPNGDIGLDEELIPAEWKLTIVGAHGAKEPLELTLDEIKRLPQADMVTELRCIEGWSQVVHWKGARLYDLMLMHPPATRSGDPPDVNRKPQDLVGYVSLSTPDDAYYVGLDMESAMHPQTLLCYEMNGKPLTAEHGAPLRLAIPVKYGIKNLKRIGAIKYTDQRPPDYWAERGYDWYAGH